jgi:tetratricopeptide (TPR) repeat protein
MAQAKIVELTAPRQSENSAPAIPQTIDELKRASAESPQNDKMRLRLAHEYQLAGMWAEAAGELALCLPARPDDPDLLCDLAACHLRQHALANAGVLVQQTLARQPAHRFAKLIGKLMDQTAEVQDGGMEISVGGVVVAAAPGLDEAQVEELLAETRSLIEEERTAEAADLLRRILSLSPGHTGTLMQLGLLHAAGCRWREAYRWFNEVRKRAPADWESRYRMAAAALQLEELDRAAAMAREAVAVDPSAAPAMELLVGIAIERFKPDEAAFWLRRLLALNADNKAASYRLAWFDLRSGRPAEAAERFKACVDDEELRADALYHLGLAQLALGDSAEAIATLSRAWRAEGSDDAALALAQAHLLAGDADGGEAALKDLAEPDQEAASLWHRLALARLSQGDAEAAKRAFTVAVKLDGRLAGGYFALQSHS